MVGAQKVCSAPLQNGDGDSQAPCSSARKGSRAFFSQQDFADEYGSIQGSTCCAAVSTLHVPEVSTWRGNAAFSNLSKTFLPLLPPWCKLAKAQTRLEEGQGLVALCLFLSPGRSAHATFPAVAEVTHQRSLQEQS